MFIAILNDEQQEALCRIVRYVAAVDGLEDRRETALQKALLTEADLPALPEPAADEAELESLLPLFDNDIARRVLVVEALAVALADAQAHPEEVRIIRMLGDRMGLSLEWMERAHDYVQRALDIQMEGRELLA